MQGDSGSVDRDHDQAKCLHPPGSRRFQETAVHLPSIYIFWLHHYTGKSIDTRTLLVGRLASRNSTINCGWRMPSFQVERMTVNIRDRGYHESRHKHPEYLNARWVPRRANSALPMIFEYPAHFSR